jgi:hypothetical protein
MIRYDMVCTCVEQMNIHREGHASNISTKKIQEAYKENSASVDKLHSSADIQPLEALLQERQHRCLGSHGARGVQTKSVRVARATGPRGLGNKKMGGVGVQPQGEEMAGKIWLVEGWKPPSLGNTHPQPP